MKNIFSLILFILLTFQSNAQNYQNSNSTILVTGKVLENETKQPLEYATIVLTPKNGKNITGGLTNAKGNFSIEVKKGNYNVSVEFISFKTKKLNNISFINDTHLKTIYLSPDAQALDEVEIIAEKSTVEIHLDKKIYNVGKDMTVKGGTASDVLDNIPSVDVDVEGNVSLRGNDNVRILINGKPSGLVGLNGTEALKQLPADAIQKVEVITSPSARYDAEGTAGILNIILRKGKIKGFNGSLTATAGNPDNFGGSANLNFRSKKLNIFTNTSYSYRNAPGNSNNFTTYFDDFNIKKSSKKEDKLYKRKRNSFNTRFGMEYYLTKKSSITGTVLYNESDGLTNSINASNEFDNLDVLTKTNDRIEKDKGNNKTTEYALNFTQDFKKSGHKLTFDFQYDNTDQNSYAHIADTDLFPANVINNPEKNSTIQSANTYLIQSDYVLPFGKDSQFEFGFKFDLNTLNSDYLVEDFDETTNQYFNNTNFSNTLKFEQNIYAVYSQYGKKINKFSYLLGLRMETTDRKINLIQTNEIDNKNYTEFFPTVNLGFEFNDTESLTLGFNRRLRRPRHWFLNPFETRTSKTYIRKGNISLDPVYTNSLDLGYLKRWNKFTLNSSIYYQHSINNFEFAQKEETRIIDGISTLVIVRSPINLSSQDRYGFEFTANYKPFKWWRLSNSFNFYSYQTKGNYNTINYDANDVSWFTRFNSRVSLPGKIDWQTRVMYRGPRKTAQSNREGMFMLNLAFSKDLFKDKATLSFNVSDLLNTRKRKSIDYTPTTVTTGEFQWRQRQILLNFTYRFNQKKKRSKPQGNYNGGGEEEQFKA
ncbi:outer membrane beta-barrel family protein [Lutibacter sp.]|uniref:outer membrane beta-barrel family protein n=1 Tax=Lutibacter sp. TaxID=1925666 RepID=UPI0025C034AE|nr:outer membrane beta-barrel family protein [Lutibacter sp.]MCF6181059.1 TonB-dependent receptor family protein [Lutibacter sp.]